MIIPQSKRSEKPKEKHSDQLKKNTEIGYPISYLGYIKI